MATAHVKGRGIQVTGIPELSRALKIVDVSFLKEFQKDLKDIAREVIKVAQGRGAPGGMLKPSATMKGAGVSFPAGGYPPDPQGYYPWLDWGGAPPRGRGVTASDRHGHQAAYKQASFDSTLGVGGFRRESYYPEGRWLYPAIGSLSKEIGDKAGDALEKVAKHEGFRVEG